MIAKERNYIILFNSPKSFYQADTCIVWCFDDRFSRLLDEFVKLRGYYHYDLIKVSGGAKALSSPDNEEERLFLIKQIRSSINFNQTKNVILMIHKDCNAYKKGINDEQSEEEKIYKDLKEAIHILQNNLPTDVKIEGVYADFEGLRLLT